MDSTSLYHINLKWSPNSSTGIKQAYILSKVKLTFATMVNTNDFRHFNQYGVLSDDSFNDVSTDSYLSLFKYDLRAKFYITRDVRFMTRVVLMGTKYKSNQYLCGFFIKF